MKIEETPEATRLVQLAEEASELAHAALKLARILMDVSPTPVSEQDARRNLREEVADVIVCEKALGISESDPDIASMRRKKLWRWQQRLDEEAQECWWKKRQN